MLINLQLRVNDRTHDLRVDPERTLLSLLRDDLGLTGVKYGCGDGKCGACTLLVDGHPTQSCSIPAGAAAGSHITTIEGLTKEGGALHPLQDAFLAAGAFQCGYCTPGMIMSALALLQTNPQPSDAEIVHAMQDNICRCGSYQRIVAAIRDGAARLLAQENRASAAVATGAPAHEERLQPVAAAYAPIDDAMPEGLVVACADPDVAAAVYGVGAPPPDERILRQIGPWLHIDGDGGITAYVGKAEVGQNIRTALAQIVAEELRVPVHAVQIVMADTGRTPYDVGTFGSRTTPITGPQLWRLGAASRELLLDLAAAAWTVDRDALTVRDGAVHHAQSGRTASFGELARDRQILRMAAEEQPVTAPAQWTVAGQPATRAEGRSFVTGQHQFPSDISLPDMLHGKILRPPAFHAEVESLDLVGAETVPGATVVQESNFIGVAAPDELSATKAVEAIRAAWRTTLQVSQPELFAYLKANPVEGPGWRTPFRSEKGSVVQALSEAHDTLQRSYTVDYIAHAPLEPRAAVAHWVDGKLTVWTGTQRPFGVRAELATVFGIAESQVRVIAPDTGAGYGGKHAGDAAIEAARLARVTGKPVKVVWTRKEEFTWAYFRPAGLIEIASAVDDGGRLLALDFHNYNSGAAGIETLYQIPNQHLEFHPADSPLRQGAYRALAATANTFARESHMDEWAHRLGVDPLEFRLRHLADPRMIAVLTAAAEAFGWGRAAPASHHGFGIAGSFDKGSYVAACVEVAINPVNGQPNVVRVVEAFDCGAIINPDIVRSQVEGAVVQGLGGALFESITFANGRILNPSFATYRVPRFSDMPAIEIVLLDRKDVASVGAGETPIIAVAPAIASALFQATGVRLRSLPLAQHGLEHGFNR